MYFSVIIPIYNAEKSLARCLESVRGQHFSDFEVIMVDDGSTDQSGEIAEKYVTSDTRFRYVYQNNSGVSVARNTGISLVKGEYVTFLDSDDVYYPTYLSSFRHMIAEYPDYGHYWCAFEETGREGKPNGKKYRYDSNQEMVVTDRLEIMTLHGRTLASSPWNKAYRKQIIQKITMCPYLSLGEDELFNFEYLDRSPDTRIVIRNIPEYGYFVVSNDTLNTKYRENLAEIYDELNQEEERYLAKWNVSEEQKALFAKVKFYRYEKVLRNTFHVQNETSNRERYATNNKVLHSREFKEVLEQARPTIHPAMKLAYKLGRYEIVLMLEKLRKLV